jgi:hypothetical protein
MQYWSGWSPAWSPQLSCSVFRSISVLISVCTIQCIMGRCCVWSALISRDKTEHLSIIHWIVQTEIRTDILLKTEHESWGLQAGLQPDQYCIPTINKFRYIKEWKYKQDKVGNRLSKMKEAMSTRKLEPSNN